MMQAVEDYAEGFVAVDLLSRGSDEFFFLLFRRPEIGLELPRFILQCFMPRETRLGCLSAG